MATESRFQILSLDGGGIKGLFAAATLAAIEEDLGCDVTRHFDLIAGTSTGGIIALGLGLGLRPSQIVEFYLTQGSQIFPGWFGVKRVQHWVMRKFSQRPLMEALQNCFKDRRLADSRKRLVIPAYNLGEDDVYIFRTPHAERLKRDYKVPAWKVALATSAAPTFFPCCRLIDSLRLIDGGVWANNPTMVGIIEAHGTLGVPLDRIHVLSIGTSDAVTHRYRKLNGGGILAWATGNSAIDVIMRGQSLGVHNQATFLLGRDHVERLNPPVAADEFSLDGIHKTADLVGKAAHFSRAFMPMYADRFGKHTAANYQPLYT